MAVPGVVLTAGSPPQAVRKDEMGTDEKAIEFEDMPDDNDDVDELLEDEMWKARYHRPGPITIIFISIIITIFLEDEMWKARCHVLALVLAARFAVATLASLTNAASPSSSATATVLFMLLARCAN